MIYFNKLNFTIFKLNKSRSPPICLIDSFATKYRNGTKIGEFGIPAKGYVPRVPSKSKGPPVPNSSQGRK